MTEFSLIVLALTAIIGWLMLGQRLEVWLAIPVATMMLGLVFVAGFTVLAERFATPEDFEAAWRQIKSRVRDRVAAVLRKIR